MHLDADVVLPQKFRRMADWAHLDESFIYARRPLQCDWLGKLAVAQAARGVVGQPRSFMCALVPPKFPVGSRWVSDIHGYVPCGFFQLFHGSELTQGGYHVKRYPFHHGDAARTDIQFGLQWDRQSRQVLPEIICLHLESEEGKIGINWEGRKTKRFGPEFKPEPPKQHPPSHPHHRPEPPRHHPEPPPRHRRDD